MNNGDIPRTCTVDVGLADRVVDRESTLQGQALEQKAVTSVDMGMHHVGADLAPFSEVKKVHTAVDPP